MAATQHVPYLGSAEDEVLLTTWLVEPGQTVKKGQPIAVIETLKAAFDVESEHDGVLLQRLAEAGTRIAATAALCVVGAPGETVAPVTKPVAKVAPAALNRAKELGIDAKTLAGTGKDGLVRVADVERAAATRPAAQPVATVGQLDPEFVALVRKDAAAFAHLASESKVALYRKHGAVLGDGCTFATGALVIADRIALGKDAFFGPETRVDARHFEAGVLLHFGARCRVRATRIACGDNAFFTDDIEIGGGGAFDPEAELRVGSHGFVGEHVHLNPCRPLVIGDEVVISRQAVVMTHSFGGSTLAGYPNRFAGVTLGDGCQIGIAAVLFPGVEVGAGAIVLSGSSVVSSVPAGRLYGGVPARDLKAAAIALTPEQLAARAAELVREFARQLELRGRVVAVTTTAEETRVEVRDGTGVQRLQFRAAAPFANGEPGLLVACRWPDGAWDAVPEHTAAIDLAGVRIRGPESALGAAFREFLRKRGVRLHPRAWAYRGGWL